MLKITPEMYSSCMDEFSRSNFDNLIESVNEENPGLIQAMAQMAQSDFVPEPMKDSFVGLGLFFYKLFRKAYEIELSNS